jgi:hypothetical protein
MKLKVPTPKKKKRKKKEKKAYNQNQRFLLKSRKWHVGAFPSVKYCTLL